MKSLAAKFLLSYLGILLIAGCGGGGGSSASSPPPPPSVSLPAEPQASLDFGIKELQISWNATEGADFYRILENRSGSGFVTVADNLTETSYRLPIAVHIHDWINTQYLIEACNSDGCSFSNTLTSMGESVRSIGYFKASNTDPDDYFGTSVTLSADGSTLAVGAPGESSRGVGAGQGNNDEPNAGVVYVFRFNGVEWQQQAYIKGSNTLAGDRFGWSVSLSGDGNRLVIGAPSEDSASTGVGGEQRDESARNAGAVYAFDFNGSWQQEAYIKASNTGEADQFGSAVRLSDDGSTLAVSATLEDGSATGIGGIESSDLKMNSGAAYIFRNDGSSWRQQAYIKASNTDASDLFGTALALSADGNVLAIGAEGERSGSTDQSDNNATAAGAAYIYRFNGVSWTGPDYLKAPNIDPFDTFGKSIDLSSNGDVLVVGAPGEDSDATEIGGDQVSNLYESAGAVYVFAFDGSSWGSPTYVKAPNSGSGDGFGANTSLSSDGSVLAVMAGGEDSNATGVGGDPNDDSAANSGATYVYTRSDSSLSTQVSYVKSSNTGAQDPGFQVEGAALSGNGQTLALGFSFEDSSATGIGGDQNDGSAQRSGAVYVY